MTILAEDDAVGIEKLVLGPFGTNAYIVTCRQTRETAVVDAPAQADTILAALGGNIPRYVLLTHSHLDHIGALAQLRSQLDVPLAAHVADASVLMPPPEILLGDGDTVRLGELELAVLHTPGHTPGSLCFRIGRFLLSGDTIFPGGPGRTNSPADFRQIVESITAKIFPLPDDTQIHPGHGEPTLLKTEKEAFAIFASRHHGPGLCGDVTWQSG
ncbi:MAG: MBL fold metallo-hydrolase [Dehalococcoidia bacterium]|nr:MBL fold metallo-hydrolase [Dehalococcoidia bacterium]